jgi:hypothetical protein
MNDNTMPVVDFTVINGKRRKQLFFKRPKGTPIPTGKWRCICGIDNILGEATDQYCKSCGSRLRLQENAKDDSDYCSIILVSHFNLNRQH